MKLSSYKELTVWQKAMMLTTDIYRVTEFYPRSELYGLTSQIRRSAVSVPSNIAEGWTRQHRREFTQFLSIALGSAAELETQLAISANLDLLSREDHEKLSIKVTEVMKMLNVMLSKLRV